MSVLSIDLHHTGSGSGNHMSYISTKRLAQILAITDEQIDFSDIAELDAGFWENAELVMPISPEKPRITVMLDTDFVEWFKQQGRDCQRRMKRFCGVIIRLTRISETSKSSFS